MNTRKMWITALTMVVMTLAGAAGLHANTTMPASPVKLIFIHHSCGGFWLADANENQIYGGLGTALMNNNYHVSATNYGWGPNAIGDQTDIPYWQDWFTGTNSAAVLAALYAETGQNVGDFGDWTRLATDPGGENRIVLFKSCFPNSDLFGNPTDPPAATVDYGYTVENAKAVYNNLLTYFATRQDKLFVAITAPPQREADYPSDYQTAAQRAANARALNNWLVNDWLDGYAHSNVAVFDYFNVLTGVNNHHRVVDNQVQHTTADANNFAYYPSDDSHPNTIGQQKATTEFVPLLNYYYNQWIGGGTEPPPSMDGGALVTSELWLKAVLQVSTTPVTPVTLVWQQVGADTTPSGARVVSGYFYADPAQFAYGSQYNPEVFVKVYIDPSGWANIAFNHVTVDPVDVFSAHTYSGTYDQYGTAALTNRLVEHTYNGVSLQ